MTGKKKSKKGRKAQGRHQPNSSVESIQVSLPPDSSTTDTVNAPPTRTEAAVAAGNTRQLLPATPTSTMNAAIGVEARNAPLLSLCGGSGQAYGIVDSKSLSLPVAANKEVAQPSFVFSAGQNSSSQRVAAPVSPGQSAADSATISISRSTRSARATPRRCDTKCPPSERFGKLGSKSRLQTNLQLAAQEVAFGQGRDPLSLVVSYEESGLRRVVKAPDGSSSDTLVDTSLRQAVAGTALDSTGWQKALNQPKEDLYFTYSTVPEGLTITKFRDVKGKILVTPLTADGGLLKLKEDAEKKRKAAEEALESVRQYLQRLKSEDEKEFSREKSSSCAHCKSIRIQLDDLLGLVKRSPSV